LPVYNSALLTDPSVNFVFMKDLFSNSEDADVSALSQHWNAVIERLGNEYDERWMLRFVRPLRPAGQQGDKILIDVPSQFTLDWVRNRLQDTIEQFLSDEIGRPISIELRKVQGGREAVPSNEAVTITPSAPSAQPSFIPNPAYRFDNFVVGQSNRMAHGGAQAVANDPGGQFNPLVIYGRSGMGKTHLLHSIANEMRSRRPNVRVEYLTAQVFAEEFVIALQTNKIDAFRRRIRSAEVWLVDDIQMVLGKDKTQEEIFHTFNYLQQSGRQMVFTADRPPSELFVMNDRLRSRLEAGLVTDIRLPDTETRIAILNTKAQSKGIELSFEVALAIAEAIQDDVRHLEGALTTVAAEASLSGQPITLELVQPILARSYSRLRPKPNMNLIITVVGRAEDITPEEIVGDSRRAPIVMARHISMYIQRRITGDSWKHIGKQFGGRDHTSVLHAVQKIDAMMAADPAFAAKVAWLTQLVTEGPDLSRPNGAPRA